MVDHQEHYGRKFYLDKKTGYWISTDYPRIRAHRWVWIYNHGIIPKGYHIHHKDENKSNNSLENLELLHSSIHLSMHNTEERRERSRKFVEVIRPLTKDWHASEEGKAWHSFHAIKNKFGRGDEIDYKCILCSNEFKSTKRSRCKFCSNACKAKHRRISKVDHIQKNCPICSKCFSTCRYQSSTFCSKKCAQQGRLIKLKL